MNGCRWCGHLKIDHANRWVPGKKWHTHAEPTDAQRKARFKTGAGLSYPAPLRTPHIVTNLASDVRTRL
jgi:hypothetical protein